MKFLPYGEKASSNICTNQALCSLAALVYLLAMGRSGLKGIATQNFQKAHYLKSKIDLILLKQKKLFIIAVYIIINNFNLPKFGDSKGLWIKFRENYCSRSAS